MIFFLGLILILTNSFEISAYPLIQPRNPNNGTDYSDNTTAWVDAPNIRGTSDLLLSCLTTLALCAWTAYHPNIHPKTNFFHTSFCRLKWMTVAIFAPELVLLCAWDQRWTAQILKRDINTIGAATSVSVSLNDVKPTVESRISSKVETNESSGGTEIELGVNQGQTPIEQHSSPTKNADYSSTKSFAPWTNEQAFFAICGGFAVDSTTFWPQKRLTFTPDGLIELAKLGLLPDVSAATVTDKSKADTGAKVLVCVQVGWFLIQSLARLAQHLPLTLLEVHVLAHVACAFLMYFLWLDKPYDAGHPIICQDERVRDMAALFAVDSGYYKRHWGQWTDESVQGPQPVIDIPHIPIQAITPERNDPRQQNHRRSAGSKLVR
ncbi:hypothetical protein AOQ84DRAFT_374944 [Glonium stellatum]|uniref:Uncharacterized protein n=1 Tax=Glonium stellatum TaxID=574774 RepID=A0A8E2F4I6_9PEZI|nr:hypothetical protein AOQ84DRAFT_374944 [Glonium stellatum]